MDSTPQINSENVLAKLAGATDAAFQKTSESLDGWDYETESEIKCVLVGVGEEKMPPFNQQKPAGGWQEKDLKGVECAYAIKPKGNDEFVKIRFTSKRLVSSVRKLVSDAWARYSTALQENENAVYEPPIAKIIYEGKVKNKTNNFSSAHFSIYLLKNEEADNG